jgi:hypothetical protein
MSGALRGLLAPFSVEITPRETTKLPPLSGLLDPGTAVYLTFLPNVPWDQTVDAVRWVAHDGMRPVPHIAARGVPDRATLRRMLDDLAAVGVEDVLLIATTPMLRPRRCATRSRRFPNRVCPGTRCTPSTAAQRTNRLPCLSVAPEMSTPRVP